MNRRTLAWPARWAGALCVAAYAPWACAIAGAPTNDEQALACEQLAMSAWPRSAADRRRLIDQMNSQRERCKDHARFLALLGGLWLEEGDADQALLWLERSLLLDPEQLGAQADHALALAAQGDLSARNELLNAWKDRPDVPALIVARLLATGQGGNKPDSANGSVGKWLHLREATLVVGHESNLNHSPRLSELTLTLSDGPLVYPLPEPQKPRTGQASLLDLSWQSAYAVSPGLLLQAGVQAVGRHSPQHPDTDWHSGQVGLAAAARLGSWRGTVQWATTWFSGELSQPYRAQRSTLILERMAWQCQHRVSVDFERRTQAGGDFLNTGESIGLGMSSMCPIGRSDWTAGLALRQADDRPLDDQRPGGRQRQTSVGLRAHGPMTPTIRAEVNLRYTYSLDAEGYSPLLADNARRKLAPTSLSIELTRPVDSPLGAGGLDLVMQLQGMRQSSNIALFKYSAVSAFIGTRARW